MKRCKNDECAYLDESGKLDRCPIDGGEMIRLTPRELREIRVDRNIKHVKAATIAIVIMFVVMLLRLFL